MRRRRLAASALAAGLLAITVWAAEPEAAAETTIDPAASPAADSAAEEPGARSALPTRTEHTWYAQALARGDAGLNVTHFWSSGPRLRAETVVAGHKIVTIVNGEWYYAFDGLLKDGTAIRRDPKALAEDARRGRPFGREYEMLLDQGAEQVREEVMLGRRTGVFRVTDRLGRREVWVTLDSQRIPLRAEIFDRRSATRRYTDYLNWQSGIPIPDAFFEPDPTIRLEHIELEEYFLRSANERSVGPVPVLYIDLLHVRDQS